MGEEAFFTLSEQIQNPQVIEVQFCGSISRWRSEGISMLGDDLANTPDFVRSGEEAADADTGGVGREEGGDVSANGSSNTVVRSHGARSKAAGFPTGGVLGTHLEPTHARDLFPCVDLPSCKAVFHLTLHGVPVHLQAISNTPVLRVEKGAGGPAVAGAVEGVCPRAVKTVAFHPTPVMPTYIFGFWVADFHHITTHALATKSSRTAELLCCGTLVPELPASSAPPPGQEGEGSEEAEEGEGVGEAFQVEINVQLLKTASLDDGRFSLDFTRRAFELFSRLFAVRFPLPKLDILCLPRMHGLGMENFGAITMLQDYMLVTADTTFVRRRRIARLICHEVCHQWYGDMVTPQSFDELWLKEGLARFFEYVAVDALDSSYRVWTNFMSEVFFQAMLTDAQRNSHPVAQQHNGNIASILKSFDTITYCKGASVLRMLCNCVGPARFLEGTRRFVLDHQYACATQEDLWKAVQDLCDRDGLVLNVRDLMQPWLTCALFPVLRVRMSGVNTISISQQPFSFFDLSGSNDGADSAAAEEGGSFRPEDAGAAGREGVTDPSIAPNTVESAVVPDQCPGPAVDGGQECPPAKPIESHGRIGDKSYGTRWVIPLRIRVEDGLRPAVPGTARTEAEEMGEKDSRFARESGARAGEELHTFLMADRSTHVDLGALSRGSINGSGVQAEEKGAREAGERDERSRGGKRPYLVMNDDHSGFFTVQYECERSWALALNAVKEGVLNECETMGFVNDLILGLHERVLVDSEMNGGSIGQCDLRRLFTRLQDVVRLLSHDRSHPAWCAGQLFIWELLLMYASNALGEMHRVSRRRQELVHRRHFLRKKKNLRAEEVVAGGVDATDGKDVGSPTGHGGAAGLSPETRQHHGDRAGSPSPMVGVDVRGHEVQSTSGTGPSQDIPAVPGDDGDLAAASAANDRLRRITAEVELAYHEAEEHVRWHSERLASGKEQAAEALESLRVICNRLRNCRAQLSLGAKLAAKWNSRNISSTADTADAGNVGIGEKVKVVDSTASPQDPR